MYSKILHQSDVAKLSKVSRACVSKWFRQKKGWVNVESETLRKLAAGLGVAPDFFLQERPDLSSMKTRFLWDHLYLNMESFVQGIAQARLPALARLVQVLGFREGEAVAGKKVFLLFDKYKKYIKPVRRKQLEILWSLHKQKT